MAYDKVVDSVSLDADITLIADAIRAKTESIELLAFPEGIAAAITNLSASEDLDDVLTEQGEIIDSIQSELVEQGVKMKQAKIVAPSLEEQIIYADEGYLIDKFKVEPITGELLSTLDADFKAANIAEGVNVFGVIGTFVPGNVEPSPLETMTWSEIAGISSAGTAADYFATGDTKTLYIGNVPYLVEIIGFDHDDLADGSGKAGITFALKAPLNDVAAMNSTSTNAGGWGGCEIRQTLQQTIFKQLDGALQTVIKSVVKKTSAGEKSTTIESTNDTLFLLSEVEVFGQSINACAVAGEGTQYSHFRYDVPAKIKTTDGKYRTWWMRSPHKDYNYYFCLVSGAGVNYLGVATAKNYIVFGFCV